MSQLSYLYMFPMSWMDLCPLLVLCEICGLYRAGANDRFSWDSAQCRLVPPISPNLPWSLHKWPNCICCTSHQYCLNTAGRIQDNFSQNESIFVAKLGSSVWLCVTIPALLYIEARASLTFNHFVKNENYLLILCLSYIKILLCPISVRWRWLHYLASLHCSCYSQRERRQVTRKGKVYEKDTSFFIPV